MNFSDKFNFTNCDRKSITLEYKIKSLLCKNGALSISQLESLLKNTNLKISKKEIYEMLQFLLVNRGNLIKDDYWDQEAKYTYLSKEKWNTKEAKNYYSLSSVSSHVDSILLIANIHIGNSKLEDLKMVRSIYDYAIKRGVHKCFHLGNLFEGAKIDDEKEINRQLNTFIKTYPNPTSEEMMTYSILGEGDQKVNEYLQGKNWWEYSDLRGLSMYCPSFYMFPRQEISTNFANFSCHMKNKVSKKFNKNESKRDNLVLRKSSLDCDISISGYKDHGMIYSSKLPDDNQNKIYLGVPSANQMNINESVGYILHFDYDNHQRIINMTIEILTSDGNRTIDVKNIINFNFEEKIEFYPKTLKKANHS